MAADEDDWYLDAGLLELRLKVETTQAGQLNVENETGRNIRTLRRHELSRRSERLDGETGRTDHVHHGVTNQGIVVDDEHDAFRVAHALVTAGRAK